MSEPKGVIDKLTTELRAKHDLNYVAFWVLEALVADAYAEGVREAAKIASQQSSADQAQFEILTAAEKVRGGE